VKKLVVTIVLFVALFLFPSAARSQCSICTKTAQQLGEKPARALNTAILYLMLTPFAIMGFVGYRWWKNNHD
jgi:TRAP-type C4-dicarboxylate transport system permease small subunit